MWPRWGRSSSARIRTSSNFSCSTFKDIQNLCKEDPDPNHRKKPPVLHRVRIAKTILRSCASCPILPHHLPLPPSENNAPQLPSSDPDPVISLAGANKRIFVYFTSLRVVRKTFEDCKTVRSILKGFRVSMDERDLSMDAGFLEELQGILGSRKLTLPRVFIGGRYVGGADEIRQLNDAGELKKLVEGIPAGESGVCDGCGGHRFVLCEQCNGSHKCYMEKGGFRSCSACNENGLTRCPSCFSLTFDLPNQKE